MSVRIYGRGCLGLLLAAICVATASAQRQHIVMTDPLTPQEQLKGFHLPPGFDIELVASEPEINKPLNFSFDSKGRLYITSTIDYPFPTQGPGNDRMTRLEDTDGDGRYDKAEDYVQGLSMPTGATLVPGGAIIFSIPNIWSYTDSNSDGRLDHREKLYSEFGNVDTHGMNNGFTRWLDGWIYACHGFRNESTVSGTGGHTISMASGNGYRFRADGSQIEQIWFGQVNPFGITFDALGNLFTADCHSKPAYCLLRGAHYPSFGKPHDGLGFGPELIKHTHGSTAISGVVYYAADQFPEEYRDTLFIGNCVTGRVNFDKFTYHGSSLTGVEQPDFVTCDDPWFRPVELKLGPDGALYIADFYNCIIGHYEVPLTHPMRDRERGRVWRVYYKGKEGEKPSRPRPVADLTAVGLEELWNRLADPNLIVRMLATHEIIDRFGADAVRPVETRIAGKSTPYQRTHALWIIEQLGTLDDALVRTLADDPDRLVRVHLVKAMDERSDWNATALDVGELVRSKLADSDAFVRRAAAGALGRHADRRNFDPLMQLWAETPPEDTYLIHTVRMAIRDHLLEPKIFAEYAKLEAENDRTRRLLDVLPGVRNAESAGFMLGTLTSGGSDPARRNELIHYVARYLSKDRMEELNRHVLASRDAGFDEQLVVLQSYRQGLQERGEKLSTPFRGWATELARQLLAQKEAPRRIAGAVVATQLRLAELFDDLAEIITLPKENAELKYRSIEACLAIDRKRTFPLVAPVLANSAELLPLRIKAAEAVSAANLPEGRQLLLDEIQIAHQSLAVSLAVELAKSVEGGEMLLAAIEEGLVSARLLQRPRVERTLEYVEVPDVVARIKKLTTDLPPEDEAVARLFETRRKGFQAAQPELSNGKKVFEKQCAICHQLQGEGTKVGPDLDGIGFRGLERLLEDTLDPNRNVDPAFRATIVITDDGLTHTGLALRDEGMVLILVDAEGKEQRIEHGTIEERFDSPLSPMPTVALDVVTEREYYDLISFLLSQQQEVPAAATSE